MVSKERYERVHARGIEHYQKVFPHISFSDYQGRGLIVGAGLGNTVLHSPFMAIDPGFANILTMVRDLYADERNSHILGQEQELIEYLQAILAKQTRNRQLIAGQVSADTYLPFPLAFFDDVISSNCLFGGLELLMGTKKSIKAIQNVMAHLKPTGKLALFPHFAIHPSEIGFSVRDWNNPYVAHYLVQQMIIRALDADGFQVTVFDTSLDTDRFPQTLQTAIISRKVS